MMTWPPTGAAQWAVVLSLAVFLLASTSMLVSWLYGLYETIGVARFRPAALRCGRLVVDFFDTLPPIGPTVGVALNTENGRFKFVKTNLTGESKRDTRAR